MDEQRPAVWWVNQGTTYSKARQQGIIWAPILDKASRTQHHWETMKDVRPGDIILHCSRGFLRAIGTAQSSASEAANPFGSQEWDEQGRLIRVKYEDLQDEVPLGSIPISVRTTAGGPFTKVGWANQGYLYRVGDTIID